jgi:DNA polymerase-2
LTVSGWLFDAYPVGDKMVVWIRDEQGRSIRLEDNWTPSIYVGSDSKADLEALAKNLAVQHYVKSHDFVPRYERIRDHEKSTVLELSLKDAGSRMPLANTIEDIDASEKFRLYNVEILPPQSYFYQHDLFPLARCDVEVQNGGLEWQLLDDVRFTRYHLPEFRVMHLDVSLKQRGRLPSFDDRIDSITLRSDGETISIQGTSEEQMLNDLMKEIRISDPDFIVTNDGDEFVLPYLLARAESNRMELMLNREPMPVPKPPAGGTTYFSYGRVHYRASSVMLYGRMHLDTANSIIHDASALPGLFELARVCRITMHSVSRSTIGRALTSMQFYLAHRRGLLVPYKPANLERLKSFRELVVADRGGLIIEPRVGVHERVAEFDFVSLYPSIISKLNIGADTINCDCCPGSANIVPELGYHVCEKHRGLVPESLEIPIQNRKEYKQLRKVATDDKSWAIFESRQGILRVIGHVSFGYQGHAHSHFGILDGHIAICAWARHVAKQARRAAEALDYDVLHLIIDSLFTKKPKPTEQQYMKLKEAIEEVTRFEISYEGEYKWIAFLPSKSAPIVGVPNRYFGCYSDGKIKDRGIETRRHDTPPLFSRFQREVLEIMAEGDSIEEVKALMPRIRATFEKYRQQLKDGRVPLVDLVFTKTLSKDSDAYSVNTAETGSIYQLGDEGKPMRPGQVLQYIITDYYRKNSRKRSIPVELVTDSTTYDTRRYIELLGRTCNTVTEPFACTIEG